MNDETTDRVSHLNELFGRNDAVMTEGRARSESTSENVPSIAISATFTADLISAPLQFWMDRLAIPARVTMASYAQLIQELLNPASVLSSNGTGFNVLLIRVQDWIRDRAGSPQSNLEHLQRVAGDLIEGMEVIRTRTKAPILVLFCPSSASLPEVYREPIASLQRDLARKFESLAYVHCWDHVELTKLYPVVDYEDPRMERLGHIPFSREYFVAMATLLARRLAALVKPQYKVIALDCDNTLWRGICGEDGVAGIELTPAHLEFQRMLVRQHDAGVLLCLCSKNNERDVAAVFEQRPDMILRQEHVIASRVNWNPKSQNLQSLAQELDLGLDSFIFVDDSAMECAEVRDNCAPVLTLQFPTTPAEIDHFGRHVWAFDRIGVTEDAKRRTEQYRQNRAREVARKDAGSLAKFLASLELVVDVSPLQPSQLARAAELVQRTNQFNLTGIRRRAGEIESLWSAGELDIRVVHVRDRFGDYGLVGALFLRYRADAIEVDTFVLSCRVLGRGVEHRIVNELGKLARARALPAVVLRYRKTSRNAPAWEFIEKHFLRFEQSDATPEQDRIFAISMAYAEATSVDASGQTSDLQQEQASTKNAQPLHPASTQWHQAAFELSRVVDIVEEMNRSSRSQSQSERDDYVAPRTPVEEAVAQIWAEVLGRDKVSVDSDFLDLGGNSLLAVQAIAHIESVLGLELSVFDFFEDPTVAGVAEKLADAAQAEAPIQPVDRSVPLPLSSAQRRLWFIDQIEGGSLAYHVPLAVKLVGSVDRDALQKALDALVARHEVLRTRFSSVGGEPVQHVVADARFQLLHGDLTELSDAVREQSMSEVSRQELTTPFDLKVGALIRGRLVRLSREEHVLLITMHHIVADGWSIGVLFQELGVLYGSFRSQRSAGLPPLPVQYADYAQWQRNWLADEQLQTQLAYWREHLQGAPQVLELPADRPRPSVQSYRGANVAVCIEPALTAELKRLSRSLNLTLAMTLQTAWAIVIARLSGTHDVVLGMPVANRRRVEIEGLIGFFVNTLAVRLPVDDDSTASDLLLRAKETLLGAYAHQDVPFELVVEALQPARSMSHSPIFQNMFVFQNAPRRATQLEGLTLSEQEVPLQTAQFETTLTLQEAGDRIVGMLNYASDLFDESTISRWLRCFQTLLQGLVLDPQLPVGRLPLLTASEQQQIIDRCQAVQTFPQTPASFH
nr:HAD-IIIC family phosphatase [Steroidobacter cummioxidans]